MAAILGFLLIRVRTGVAVSKRDWPCLLRETISETVAMRMGPRNGAGTKLSESPWCVLWWKGIGIQPLRKVSNIARPCYVSRRPQ